MGLEFQFEAQKNQHASKPITTIKSPVCFSNYDERTSSLSEITDNEDPFPLRTGSNSDTDDEDDVKSSQIKLQENDNDRVKTGKSVQIREASYKRPL